jgi:hypothetical protein
MQAEKKRCQDVGNCVKHAASVIEIASMVFTQQRKSLRAQGKTSVIASWWMGRTSSRNANNASWLTC